MPAPSKSSVALQRKDAAWLWIMLMLKSILASEVQYCSEKTGGNNHACILISLFNSKILTTPV